MKRYVLVGLSHKTAPLDLREKCRIEDPVEAIRELRELADEAAFLITCNRFEIYAHGGKDPERVREWLVARLPGSSAELRPLIYLRTGRNACKHLFFVTASLDSLVVGETQIRGQVKQAYLAAIGAGGTGPMLHKLFQAALRVSKQVSEQTGVGRGNVSVAGAAADLAERVFGGLDEGRVLVVGAGETAELVMFHLQARGVAHFRIANRSLEHAADLAKRFGAEAGPLESLETYLPDSDVVVAAAGAEKPLISAGALKRALRKRRGRPIVAIDIAVPRCIDDRADRLDNVYRYDMEALSAVTEDALRHRRKEFIQCCTLVDAAALRLAAETRAREAGAWITELREAYQEVAAAELEQLERHLPDLDEEGRHRVRRTVYRIIRKLLHPPVTALREGRPEEAEVIRRAFRAGTRRGRGR